jgi:hypothetical protein
VWSERHTACVRGATPPCAVRAIQRCHSAGAQSLHAHTHTHTHTHTHNTRAHTHAPNSSHSSPSSSSCFVMPGGPQALPPPPHLPLPPFFFLGLRVVPLHTRGRHTHSGARQSRASQRCPVSNPPCLHSRHASPLPFPCVSQLCPLSCPREKQETNHLTADDY